VVHGQVRARVAVRGCASRDAIWVNIRLRGIARIGAGRKPDAREF